MGLTRPRGVVPWNCGPRGCFRQGTGDKIYVELFYDPVWHCLGVSHFVGVVVTLVGGWRENSHPKRSKPNGKQK